MVAAAPSTSAFAALTALLDSKPHAFALPEGEASLAFAAEEALKEVFTLALSTENAQYPRITEVLSLGTSDALESSIPITPLDTLYTDGMDPDQIWEQLEMRSANLCNVLEEIGMLDKMAMGGGDEGSLTGEEKAERGILDSDEEEGDSEEGSDDELSFDGIDDMEDSGSSGEDDEDEDDEEFDSDEEELGLDADGEERSLEFGEEDDLGMDEDEGMEDDEDEDEEDDEDEEEEDEDDDTGRRIEDLDMPGSKSSRKKFHPVLDDPFFSIHDFNRETEELEAFEVSNGKLGLDDDEDEEDEDEDDDDDLEGLMSGAGGNKVDMWANVEAANDVGTDEVKYADFFAPPAKVFKPTGSNAKASSSSFKGKKVKSNAKPSFDEMDDDLEDEMMMDGEDGDEDLEMEDYDEDEAGSDDLDDGMDVTSRAKGDLFADDDDEDGDDDSAPLSTHAKRLAALSAQIASLEQENVGAKPWALSGEAGSRSRPINAILEEDLEFETVGKQVPVVTEEKVKGLEEMIKKRILDNDFNDVLRRRPLDSKPFLPSRVFELNDQQSTKSLAQIYEDQYTASTSTSSTGKNGVALDDRDGKLAKEHEEIEKAWGEICYKLDALSNANFTPKQPKAQIQTVSNLPSLSLETALPPTQRASHLLAPEEVFQPPSASALTSKSELTPAQKRALHNKEKKTKKKHRDALAANVASFGGGSGVASRKKGAKGEKGAKEEALRNLVKAGKGVTVIGKTKKDFTGKGERKKGVTGEGSDVPQDGARLKL